MTASGPASQRIRAVSRVILGAYVARVSSCGTGRSMSCSISARASTSACAPISARCTDSSPPVTSLGMRCGNWSKIGPLSRAAVICRIVTAGDHGGDVEALAEEGLERRDGELGGAEEDHAHLQLAGRLGRDLLEEPLLSLARLLPFGHEEAAFHGAQVVEEEDTVEVVDLVLDGAGLIAAHFGAGGTAVAVERLDHHALRSFDVAEDLRDREAPFLGDLDLGAALDDHGVDEHQRGRVLLAHVHDRDALRDADLVGGEPHALGGAHRFEQVVHEPPHGVVHAGHGRRALAQHRRAEQVEAADGHDAFASTARLTMLAMLPRRTTSLASPLRIVTSLSFKCTTSPTMPPEVTIWSPRCSVSSSFLCCSCWRRCGRRIRKYRSPKIRPSCRSSSPIPGPALPDGASSSANRP